MQWRNSAQRYGAVHQFLHWSMALCFILMLLMGFFLEAVRQWLGTPETFFIHKSLGATLLMLALLRLGWRWIGGAPLLPAGMSAFERLAAHLGHAGLYVLMIGMPLSGWLMSDSAGRAVSFWGWFDLPALAQQDKALRGLTGDLHQWGAWALAVLIGVHFLAALYHQWVRKDGLINRMLP